MNTDQLLRVKGSGKKFGDCNDLTEETAPIAAAALGGDAWQSGGGIWLIVKRCEDGRVATISSEVVKEYENEEAFEEDRARSCLVLT
jgi:hypothetical protein